MGDIEEEDSDDEDYTAGDSDHDNDKADEADDDYDYDSDDGRLEEDDENIGEGDFIGTSDASDEDLDCCPTEDTSDGSDDSDYDSAFSEEGPAPRKPGARGHSGPRTALASTDTAADSPKTDISTEAPSALHTATISHTPSTVLQATRQHKRKRSTPRYRQGIYTRVKTNSATPTDQDSATVQNGQT